MTIDRLITLAALCLILIAPAVSAAPEIPAEETSLLLEPVPDFKTSPAFRSLLKAAPGTGVFEIRKIEYLLERIGRSDVVFIRNGQEHTGEIAALHMRWKYARYKTEIKTGDDFVRKVANGSRKTREDYKIKMTDGQLYRSEEILLNELAVLDEVLGKEIS